MGEMMHEWVCVNHHLLYVRKPCIIVTRVPGLNILVLQRDALSNEEVKLYEKYENLGGCQ